MATIQDTAGTLLELDTYKQGARVHIMPQGAGHALNGISGLIAAASTGTLFTMRASPNADANWAAYITRWNATWTTTTAFTTPATIRNLYVGRSAIHATPSGGTAIIPITKDSADAASQFSSAASGDARISTTAVLTITGITWETNPHASIDLTASGALSATKVVDWNYLDGGGPLAIAPGQLFGIRTNGALDAAGVGTLSVNVEWVEGTF